MCPNEAADAPSALPGRWWHQAWEVAQSLLPQLHGRQEGANFPDASYLIGLAQTEGFPHQLTVISEVRGGPVPKGTFEAFADRMETRELLALLFSDGELRELRGEAVVIDDCTEPHFIDAQELASFLDWHEENIRFPFHHDLVLFFPECGRGAAFHHGGAVLHIFPGENVPLVARPGETVVS